MREVLAFLDDVLTRIAANEAKRRHMLRPLGVASRAYRIAAADAGADAASAAAFVSAEGPAAMHARVPVAPAAHASLA